MTKKITAPKKKAATKDKKGNAFVWNKGTNKETVKIGDVKLTIRGLTYRELLHLAPMEKVEADLLTLKMAIVGLEGLTIEDEVVELQVEDYDFNGKTVKIMTEDFFEAVFEARIFIIAQALQIVQELSGTTIEEAEAVKFFRS